MTPFDKKYLSLQFLLRVHQNSGTGFQTFFENIMEKAYPDYQKIRPYGKEGDQGNDGYRPAAGIYYQVYAPLDPTEREAAAAEKFKEDFEKLKAGWDQIATIREYDFVYNDKGLGLTIKLEAARAELQAANPTIDFKIFTPKQLENVFHSLASDQIASLDFDVDSRNAIAIARDQLSRLDEELDAERREFVLRVLDTIRDVVAGQNDEELSLEFELLEARALQKSEQVRQARAQLESVARRYPTDPRAFLYLADIYLNNEDFDRNAQLLEEAERIAPGFWLLHIHKLLRQMRMGIQVTPLDEATFPTEPRPRANFYRLGAILLEQSGDHSRATAFIERSLRLNDSKFVSHDVKLSFLESQALAEEDDVKRQQLVASVLLEISATEAKFAKSGGLGARAQSLLNARKLHIYLAKDDFASMEALTKDTFELVLNCYPDELVEKIIAGLINHIALPAAAFARLQDYLKGSDKPIADGLAQIVFLQFIYKDTLFTNGKAFVAAIAKPQFVGLITALEQHNYDRVLVVVDGDVGFAVELAMVFKDIPELRKRILESLPDDGSVNKDKLRLMFHYDAGELDEAFEIVQRLDLSSLSYGECVHVVGIAQEKKAWDAVIVLLEKILLRENDQKAVLRATLQLFTANLHLERFLEVIRIGTGLLDNAAQRGLLDDHNVEILTVQTAYSYLRRGDAGLAEFVGSHESLLRSFEAKISVQAEAYLKSGDAKTALRSVVEGIELLKSPTPEQYGSLFMTFTQIGNLLPELTLESANEVTAGSFVRLKELDRWYFIGDGNELDASKVHPADAKYGLFIGKKPGEEISFPNRYRAETPAYVIEAIYPVDKYILWQSTQHAQKLSAEQRWDEMEIIDVPITEGGVDTQYLIARLGNEAQNEFFTLYCEQNVPLAFLARSEGGVAGAIGRIATSKRGFIKALAGSADELNEQREVARKIVAGAPFYLDGTSAVMLSETGILEKIAPFITGLKVPQAVVTLLLSLRDKFEYIPGQAGHMAYVDGQLRLTDLDREKNKVVKDNFTKSIAVLEESPARIAVISAANKANGFMEQQLPASLVDACVLAQKAGTAVLTEDFLYLKANEIETKKPAPPYCSSIALLGVLYEDGKLGFDEYLDYFGYLAAYRVRFLPVTTDDLEKAVFGGGTVKVLRPEYLRKLRLDLTLSEEYGVAPRTAVQVVGSFLFRVLTDDSLSRDIVTKIFAEIVSTFPTKENRKSFSRLLLIITVRAINVSRTLAVGSRIQEKINALEAFLKVYGPDELIVPR